MAVARLILVFVVIKTINASSLLPIDHKEPCEAAKYCRNGTCSGFDSLSELNFGNCWFQTNYFPSLILVFPDKTILDSGFEVIAWFGSVNTMGLIGLENLDGIDLEFFAELRSADEIKINELVSIFYPFYYSTLGWYYKGEYLLTPAKCTSQSYEPLLNINTRGNVLGAWQALGFRINHQKDKMCKYLFQNLSLDLLEISKFTFEFMDDNTTGLNFTLNQFYISEVSKLELNEKVLSPSVYQNVTILFIRTSIIFHIQEDLFGAFHNLRQINLQNILNLAAFLHGPGGVAWLQYLNYNSTIFHLDHLTANETQFIKLNFNNISTVVNVLIYFLNTTLFPYYSYQFPDQDFCLFHELPFERLVFITINKDQLTSTSCCLAWLSRYEFLYSSEGKTTANYSCDFANMLEICEIKNKPDLYQDDPYIMWYTWSDVLNKARGVLVDNFRQGVCVLAVLINLVVIITIIHNHKRRGEIRSQCKDKKKEIILLDQLLYQYIFLNSIFNCLFSFNYLVDSLVLYKATKSLDIYEYVDNSYKSKAIAINVIGSVLKLMSNFSLLLISINRYLLIGKDHPEWIVKFSQIKIKWLLVAVTLLSILLSSVVYFQLYLYSFRQLPSNYYLISYTNLLYFYRQFDSMFQSVSLLNIFNIIHDLFSNFLFCIILLVMDILTAKKLHEAFREKKKVVKAEEIRIIKKSERRSIMMVVSNSLVRIPETLTIILYYVTTSQGKYVFKSICIVYSNCSLFVEIANVFYITWLCFYLFFYVKFNKMFKHSFQILCQSVLGFLKCGKSTSTD